MRAGSNRSVKGIKHILFTASTTLVFNGPNMDIVNKNNDGKCNGSNECEWVYAMILGAACFSSKSSPSPSPSSFPLAGLPSTSEWIPTWIQSVCDAPFSAPSRNAWCGRITS